MTQQLPTTFGLRDLLEHNPMVGDAKVGRQKYWTNQETKVLHASYPAGGVAACLPLLPGRTAHAIYQYASKLKLKSPVAAKWPPRLERRWESSPQIDEAIRRVYTGEPRHRAVLDLAATIGRPRWWVSKRALKLGVKVPRFKEPDWSEDEIELISELSHRDPERLSLLLKRHGFKRTPASIVNKLKRVGVTRGRNADPNHYTGHALAQLFGVDSHCVCNWIRKGWLRAGKRETDRTPQQGGDEYWIHRRDIRRFVIESAAIIDFRKLDKIWLVELLTSTLENR